MTIEGPLDADRSRWPRWVVLALISACVIMVGLTLALVINRAWPRRSRPKASVVAYTVSGDSAFLAWRDDRAGWLSRVDSTGRTTWIRRLPDPPQPGDSIRLAGDVIGVRYSHDNTDHAMVGFTFDGRQIWDVVLSRFRPQPIADEPRYGMTYPTLDAVSGIAADGHFVEWVDAGDSYLETAIDARSGEVAWSRPSVGSPSSVRSLGDRVLQFYEPSRMALLQSQGVHGALLSMRPASGESSRAVVLGNGCVVGADYITVVDQGSTAALVAFPAGDLARPRVIASDFDPLGEHRPFYVVDCGIYDDRFVFLLDRMRRNPDDDAGRVLVMTDRGGASVWRLILEDEALAMIEDVGPVRDRFPGQATASGQLGRFLPIAQPQAGTLDALLVLDLQNFGVAHQSSLERTVSGSTFHDGLHWYRSEVTTPSSSLEMTMIDGNTGQVAAVVEVHGRNDIIIDHPLLPNQIGAGKLWVVGYGDTSLGDPPIAILDAVTLEPVHVSRHLRVDPIPE